MLDAEIEKVRRGEMTIGEMEAAILSRRIARADAAGINDAGTEAYRKRLRQLRGEHGGGNELDAGDKSGTQTPAA